jgi:hypothetical protein
VPVGGGGEGAKMLHSHPSFATPYKAVMATTVNIFQGIGHECLLRQWKETYKKSFIRKDVNIEQIVNSSHSAKDCLYISVKSRVIAL